MDVHKEQNQEIKHSQIGFYAIFIESLTIVFSFKKLFTQITLATIFPLSLIFLIHQHISYFYANISDMSTISIVYFVLKALYFLFFLVLSLLSTSSVVYSVARFYTTKPGIVTFSEVMSVVPKVWKRVMVTFIWSFVIVLAYNAIVFCMLILVLQLGSDGAGPSITGLAFATYMVGFVCVSVVWHLASVVSVLEEDCGVEALIRSVGLVRGKMVISLTVFVFLYLCFFFIDAIFQRFVVFGVFVWGRIGCGILCFLFLSGLTLLGLVIQTVIYFVCKSYYYENIDKSYLADDHIEVYLGDYASLRSSNDVQVEQFYV